ncbi:hypothetical protein [Candidatus Methylacidithermus pantelleriae]|uniref:Uncharacterized protein n=1 Tax=Candidatus Methylacidithermus pantelleriae TaxID=2744239 RepID=A0A8J2BN87_9BACT|nr:hypothetical protein [Candidatus Methylacidithermus pantelleriae]CAF0692984.1 hypothetical protein MPNT_130032 [Candidatus Methylacidithermus pantelleriae]
MYVQEVGTCQRGKVYRSVLVRESYRVGKQVKTRILCNLTRMPVEVQLPSPYKRLHLRVAPRTNLACSV